MSTHRSTQWAAPLLLIALFLGLKIWPPFAKAEDGGPAQINTSVAESYRSDKQTAAFRSSIAVVDTAATTVSDANLALCSEFDCGAPGVIGAARKTITVTPYFSVAAATVSVTVYTAYKADPTVATYTGVKKQGPVTFTAPASGSARGGLYIAPTEFFDSTGANVAFIVVSTAPSSGTATFWVGSQ